MKKKYSSVFSIVSLVVVFFAGAQVAYAGVVQDFLGQYMLAFEARYRDPVAGQANNPQADYRTQLVSGMDALITCLYETTTTGHPNWQFGGVTTNDPSTTLMTKMIGPPLHPCGTQQATIANVRARADADPNGKYPAVIIADRTEKVTFWRTGGGGIAAYDTNLGNAAGRDQAARQKLNAFSDCLLQPSGTTTVVQALNVTDPVAMRTAIRNNQSHPCRAALLATESARPGGTVADPAAPGAAGGNPASPGGANPAPIVSGAPAGNGTIYTGPGFVNVTPFSVFGKVSVDKIINNVISYISGFLAIIAVLSIMYGGVLYMTAGGDNGKIGKAKQIIMLTGVGIVVASFSYIVVVFVTRIFYGS